MVHVLTMPASEWLGRVHESSGSFTVIVWEEPVFGHPALILSADLV